MRVPMLAGTLVLVVLVVLALEVGGTYLAQLRNPLLLAVAAFVTGALAWRRLAR